MKKFKYLSKKVLCLVLICAMLVTSMGASFSGEVAYASGLRYNENEYLYNPNTEQFHRIIDKTQEVERLTANNETELVKEFENKYLERNLQLSYKPTDDFAMSLNTNYPIPGGVGYGVFYESDFQHDFQAGSVLATDIICPTNAGGNVGDWLYLTSTNRTVKGTEAFIGYWQQDEFKFIVWDWAVNDDNDPTNDGEWVQVDLSYDELSEYTSTKYIDGKYRQIVTLQNRTEQVTTTNWQNDVFLYNYQTNDYDLMYSNTYPSTLSEQQDSYYGSWGPIVETFQDSYTTVNEMGFYNFKVATYSDIATHGSFENLTTSNSYIRKDTNDFSLEYIVPNRSFIVK